MLVIKLILMLLFIPLSWIYCLVTGLRNFLFDKSILKSRSFNVPIISIGNISAGGTGKTPFVIALSNWLEEQEYRVGIISRGYRRRSHGQIVVKDGTKLIASARQAGDEPYLIAQSTGKTVIIADADRVAAARAATEEFHCNIVIADDAFQHRRLNRSLDIVLWDSYHDPDKAKIIPAGRLRESLKGLRRANLLLVSRSQIIPAPIEEYFKHRHPALFIAPLPLLVTKTFNFNTGSELAPGQLNNKKILGFCGLGNPDQFFQMLENITGTDIIRKTYLDHYQYSQNDVELLRKTAMANDCQFILTTGKDAVNLPASARNLDNLYIVEITYEINKKLKAVISEKLPPLQ